MKLGIMQPYLFPYLGYFDLINRTDKWVVFDIVNYKPKSWMNRNRVLHPTNGWQYISVPVEKKSRGTKMFDTTIVDVNAAGDLIIKQLEHYKNNRAPFTNQVINLIESSFEIGNTKSLVKLNVKALKNTCDYLGMDFDYSFCSEMDFELPQISHAGQWALEISALLGADEYINPPGGRDIFREEEFTARNIKLSFTKVEDFKYDCSPYTFVEHLSIIDVLMWNSPDKVKAALDSFI
jgi:hypothetical protein